MTTYIFLGGFNKCSSFPVKVDMLEKTVEVELWIETFNI